MYDIASTWAVPQFKDIGSLHQLLAELSSASKIQAAENARVEQSNKMIDALNKLDLSAIEGLGKIP